MKDKELQLQIKLKELEFKKSTPISILESSHTITSATTSFDVSQQVHHSSMNKRWISFPTVATSLHWPPETHTMLLQSVLI